MQLYALNGHQKTVLISSACKGEDYFCPECKAVVHARGGLHRQDHFYHLAANTACRQNGKSQEHLQVQYYFLKTLPAEECLLEHCFDPIGRIADVYWPRQNIVFEVQCSPITAAEVSARNRDYASLGIQAVWVLHDGRFNKSLIASPELLLADSFHYYTNIDAYGDGCIYDFFSIAHQGKRLEAMPKLPIDVGCPKEILRANKPRLQLLKRRMRKSKLHFGGDLLDKYLEDKQADYCSKAALLEQRYYNLEPVETLLLRIKAYLLLPFQLLFQIVLERFCR